MKIRTRALFTLFSPALMIALATLFVSALTIALLFGAHLGLILLADYLVSLEASALTVDNRASFTSTGFALMGFAIIYGATSLIRELRGYLVIDTKKLS